MVDDKKHTMRYEKTLFAASLSEMARMTRGQGNAGVCSSGEGVYPFMTPEDLARYERKRYPN
jgi:hypothetical protein